jgi:hypothetical protein
LSEKEREVLSEALESEIWVWELQATENLEDGEKYLVEEHLGILKNLKEAID